MGLKYLYKGFYFSKITDSYADYGAWSESCTGAGGLPSDESIELFLENLRSNDINIVEYNLRVPQLNLKYIFDKYSKSHKEIKEINYFDYDGFILTHFENEKEFYEILSEIENGKRLILIRFNPKYPLIKFDDNLNKKFYNYIKISLKDLEKDIYIKKYGLGKILIINGSAISDYNLDSWIDIKNSNKPVKNYPNKFLESIVVELKKYDFPYFIVEIISTPPQVWIVNEKFITTIQVENLGNKAKAINLSLKIDNNIEPFSSTDLYFTEIESGEKKKVNFIFVSNRPGLYKNFLSIELSFKYKERNFIKRIFINCQTNFIEINNALKENGTTPNLEVLIKKYKSLQGQLKNINDFEKLIMLVDIDASSTITKSRTILEKIINKIFKKNVGDPSNYTLDQKIKKLKDKGIIDNKSVGWINTVRILGNIVIHPGDDIIQASKDDALLIVNILLNIVKEILDKGLF